MGISLVLKERPFILVVSEIETFFLKIIELFLDLFVGIASCIATLSFGALRRVSKFLVQVSNHALNILCGIFLIFGLRFKEDLDSFARHCGRY